MRKYFKHKSIVITGAASGIGRATAYRFAKHEAKLALIDTNKKGLRSLQEELQKKDIETLIFVIDVTNFADMQAAAQKTAEAFGGIDVWVNNAGIAVYGEIIKIPVQDAKRVMDVNFFGQLNGVHAAYPYLNRPESLGQLIGIGSVLAEITAPLIGIYTASKHALHGMYKSLHEEFMHNNSHVKVSAVLPSSINTPLFQNTKTYIGVEPQVFPPYYSPYWVADIILKRAKKEKLTTIAGNAGSFFVLGYRITPLLYHWMQSQLGYWFQHTKKPKLPSDENNLDDPVHESGRVYGDHRLYIPAMLAKIMQPHWLLPALAIAFSLRKRYESPS
jgi:short-subunit dehydrogenase